VRVEALEQDLRDRLPIGSTREQVQDWFASHGITYGDTVDSATGKRDGYCATMPNDSWVESAEIRISFEFDDRGRLTKFRIIRFVYCM
jgi:hypothetical protein